MLVNIIIYTNTPVVDDRNLVYASYVWEYSEIDTSSLYLYLEATGLWLHVMLSAVSAHILAEILQAAGIYIVVQR